MKNNILTIFMLLGMISNSFSQEVIDLFIWGGQSNAQGWQGDAAFYPADPNNYDSQIRLNYTFIGNSSSNGWITMQAQVGRFASGHFGSEVTFSRKLKEAGYNPAIFKYSLGGSSLWGNWLGPEDGGFYDDLVTNLNAAITDLENQGHTVNVRGVIWIQGESDADNATHANAFQSRLSIIINDMRNNVVNNISLPIILGVDEQHSFVVSQPAVLNAHQEIAENDSNIKFTSMYGLPKADATHLTPAGLITHGEQIFETFTLLLSGTNSYSSCTISSTGNTVSSLERISWGQSFKPSCSGQLSEISFNAATNVTSSLTISISNGADCNATQLHTQTINSITDGDNLVSLSNQIYLDKEHTYYINITSDLGVHWKVRFNNTSQIIGSLRTYLDEQASSTCGWNFPDFDLNFSASLTNVISSVGNINSNNLLFIYPNPSQGNISIKLGDKKDVSIKVFTIKGQLVYSEYNINSSIHNFHLDGMQGLYILELISKDEIQVYKIIKK